LSRAALDLSHIIFLRWRSDTSAAAASKLAHESIRQAADVLRVEMTLLLLAAAIRDLDGSRRILAASWKRRRGADP